MTREEVLKEFVRWTNWPETPWHETTFWHSTDAMAEEIVRLRERLAAVERERENVSSQLWDCTNERDGYKHRAERAERVVEAARAMYEVDMALQGRLLTTSVSKKALKEIRAESALSLNDAMDSLMSAVRALNAEAQP